MKLLSDFPKIEFNLKNASVSVIKLLHNIVFGEVAESRSLRKNLKKFQGFSFDADSREEQDKINEVRDKFSLSDFTIACHLLNLDYKGDENTLAVRLIKFLNNFDVPALSSNLSESESDSEEEEDEEGELQEKVTLSHGKIHKRRKQDSDRILRCEREIERFSLTFRDVEDSIRVFDGKSGYPIKKWIEDFEEIANEAKWNDFQKLIYAKNSLRGMAKTFIQSENRITSWQKLKSCLIKEFYERTTTADIYKTLMKRKKKREESYEEYMIIMKEIGSRASIEPESVIQCIIDGIPDDPERKAILYGAETYDTFKRNLKVYSKIKSDSGEFSRTKSSHEAPRKNYVDTRKSDVSKSMARDRNCYNCGTRGHEARECPAKEKGQKCFKCNEFGHIAPVCTNSRSSVKQVNISPMEVTLANNRVVIKIENCETSAMLDTGADVSVIREDIYFRIGSPKLTPMKINLKGIGDYNIETLGCFQTIISLYKEEFTLRFHVVPLRTIQSPVVIGRDILDQADIIMSSSEIQIKRKVGDNFLMLLSVKELIGEEVDLSHLREHKLRSQVEDVIRNYHPRKTQDTEIEMKIILKENNPIYQSPRRLPLLEKQEVDNQIEQWLEDGVIRHSCSEFSSPVVVVRKRDKSARICIDYRKINRVIVKDRHPLPVIEDQLDQLQEATVFSTIDLKSGFHHVPVEEGSKKFTAFVTHNGHYEFNKMPFGLCNSPAVFQRFINHIFRDLIKRGVALPYMDDVIIPSADEEEGCKNLKEVLDVAASFGLAINWKKCQFLKRNVNFLGHIIENKTVRPSEEKVEAVRKFPILNKVKDVRSFLGLTGYFRKFIPFYSLIARPLTNLLKANVPFNFGLQEQLAFKELKARLCSKPVLHLFQQGRKMEVHTDASKEGFGAILLQESPEDHKLHPIFYMSKKTTDLEKKYSSYELEVLAVMEALKKFRVYLLGNHFKIVTDCSAFQKTMDKRDLTTRVARWALLLEEFDYEIQHRAGTRMPHVDALSRHPILIMTHDDGLISRFKDAQDKDEKIRAIRQILEKDEYEDYFMKSGLLYKYDKGRELLVVPRRMQANIIRKAHENGHFSTRKTEELIRREFYIPAITEKIQECVRSCVPCILVNRKEGKKEGFLHPLAKGEGPLETLHLDHLGPLASTNKNYNHILTVIDDFTKFVWLFPVKTTTSGEVIRSLILLQKTFGNPSRIISDRGSAFSSHEFEGYCREEGIEHHMITTGVPRGNGQVERVHRTIIPMIAKLSLDDPTKWYRYIDRVQKALNGTFQRSINTTPFELLFGVKMKSKEDFALRKEIEAEIIKEFQEAREEQRKNYKEQILRVQEENKRTYNLRRRKAREYQLDDLVAIKRTQFGSELKLQKRYLGPYQVINVKPNDRYDVKKVGDHEGPNETSTCAEYMNSWAEDMLVDEFGANSTQDGRDVGE